MHGINRNAGIKPNVPGLRIGSNHVQERAGIRATEGETTRVRILEYMGGGKFIVDLEGQRVIANTTLSLEKGQELEVIVKNMGGKIILQLMSNAQQNIRIEQPMYARTALGSILSQLTEFLENSNETLWSVLDDKSKGLLQNIQEQLQSLPVDTTKADVPQQIRNAINELGHDYEHKLAESIIRGSVPIDDPGSPLKSKLMQLQAFLAEEQFGNSRIPELLEKIGTVLENIQFQQLESISHTDKFHHFHVQIPFLLSDQTATAELEFFRPKTAHKRDDDSFNIELDFNLDRLGHIEFSISVTERLINCQIMAEKSETYELAKEHSEHLEKRLKAQGYDVVAIRCVQEAPEKTVNRYKSGANDIDVVA